MLGNTVRNTVARQPAIHFQNLLRLQGSLDYYQCQINATNEYLYFTNWYFDVTDAGHPHRVHLRS